MSTPPALRVWESHLRVYRRLWRTNVFGTLLQPLGFLGGLGLGVGALVNRNDAGSATLGGVAYIAFLAPGLLATTAMFGSSQEAMWPVIDGFMWTRNYVAMSATPIDAREVVDGWVLWMASRLAFTSTLAMAMMQLFPGARSWGLVLAVPCAVLTGLAFATPIAAFSATRHVDNSFPALQRFVITPLFLFGGAFYPIDQLPGAIRPVAWVTPLWHGVELCRGFALHTLGTTALAGHLAVLLAWIGAGWLAARVTFARRLAE